MLKGCPFALAAPTLHHCLHCLRPFHPSQHYQLPSLRLHVKMGWQGINRVHGESAKGTTNLVWHFIFDPFLAFFQRLAKNSRLMAEGNTTYTQQKEA